MINVYNLTIFRWNLHISMDVSSLMGGLCKLPFIKSLIQYVILKERVSSLLMQYARALKEKGVEVKVISFPEDVHGIER